MRNIFLIPTNKPSRLYKKLGRELKYDTKYFEQKGLLCINQNIFITSDEEIKEGDFVYDLITETVYQLFEKPTKNEYKIILTTDLDLQKDGVQEIPDEFLEWFVKNPSCEEIEVNLVKTPDGIFYHQENVPYSCYKIIISKEIDILELGQIIPKEKPKEEIPNDLDSVLAKISDVNDLGISNWYEVVYYYDNKWYSYNGSKTFNNGEQVLEWKYCKEIF